MSTKRSGWARGIATLAVLGAFGAVALITNAGAVAEKKEASKKFVKKQVANAFDAALSDGELIRYSVKTDAAGADTTIATIGNFTFKANCEIDTGDNTIIGRVLITTSADNAAYASDDDDEPDFDTADNANPEVWLGGDTGVLVGDPAYIWSDTVEGNAVGPTGTTLQGEGTFFANVAGFDCTLEGYLLPTSV